MIVVVKCNNGIVTDKYLENISDAVSEALNEEKKWLDTFNNIKKYDKNTLFIVARVLDAFKLIMLGYNKIIMWCQGIEPEESYMIHKSKIRFWILSKMEKFVLKHSIFVFFVSNAMLEHYQKKYKIDFKENYYCMPCMNTNIQESTFFTKGKYSYNKFVYVGSMAIWQKFEDVAKCYKKIEELDINDPKLYVYTKEKEEAERILKENKIYNYVIDYVKPSELPKILSDKKYGFILREDNIVNNVATPTKISTYLSCGLIPIYSSCLKDFESIAQNLKYVIRNDKNIFNKIKMLDNDFIDVNEILKEYKNIFNTYYSTEIHKKNIENKIKRIFEVSYE